MFAFLSPCIIPMLGVYLALITGMTLDQLKTIDLNRQLQNSLIIKTIFFVLGFGLIFTLAGGLAGFVGQLFQKYTIWLGRAGGLVIVLFGLQLSGLIKLNFLSRVRLFPSLSIKNLENQTVAPFLIGIFFAVVCSHCIGPLLYSILIYAGLTGSATQGMLSMAMFSAGLAIPYLLIALGIKPILNKINRLTNRQIRYISIFAGSFLVLFGLLLFFNKYQFLVELTGKILPYNFPGSM